MRELNFIEDNGLFGITFKSDDKNEANTILNAIQRFINNKIIEKNDNSNCQTPEKDYSRCPIEGSSKNVYWNLFPNDRLIEYYNNNTLEQGYKDFIKDELNKRGVYIDDDNIKELEKQIKEISKGEQFPLLSDEDLEKISLLESKIKKIDNNYNVTAQHLLNGRKFNHSRELENKITKGRRLSELTIEELKELREVTMIDHYKEDIEKEISKRECGKSFEEEIKNNNEIIEFGESKEKYNNEDDTQSFEDPLSVDEDNVNKWDFNEGGYEVDEDGDKVDGEGNKLLFDD